MISITSYLKKYWQFNLIILILIVLNIYLIENLKITHDKIGVLNKEISEKQKIIEAIKHGKEEESNNFLFSNVINGKLYPELVTKVKDENWDGKNKLVFRFTELDCDKCIDQQLDRLNRVSSMIGNDNIFLLTSYKLARDIEDLKKRKNIQYKIIEINRYHFSKDLEKLDVPFYFVFTIESKVDNLFIPNINEPETADRYINLIRLRYFK